MAILEKLRKRAGIFLAFIIGLALFGFVLQDLFTSGGSIFTGNKFEIAEINGKSISYQLYQSKIEQMVNVYEIASNRRVDESTQESITEQTWQELIREYVLEQKYRKLGIDVSSDELFNLVQGPEPHPMITQIFTDPQTGIFNRPALLNFLKTKEQDPTGAQNTYWLFLEDEIYNERKFNKYNTLASKGLFVTSAQVENSFLERGKKADFEFIYERYSSIPDSLVKIQKSDLEKYYSAHKENYKQTASRDIEYVAFDIKPSPEDIKAAEDKIAGLKDEFIAVTEVEQFVNLNSDVSYNPVNYKDGELPETINAFMFSAKPGEVYGPYFENNAYKLARLVEINYLPDSVKARHILIQPRQNLPQNEAEAYAKNQADSLKALIDKGVDFALLALQFSSDQGSARLGGNLGWFREGMMVQEFNDACFSHKKGDVFVVQTQFGYHIVHIQDVGSPVKKVKVAVIVHELSPSSQTYQNIYSVASKFAGTCTTYEKFLNTIESQDLSKRIATDIQENAKTIPGLENPRSLVMSAFKTDLRKIVLDFSDQAVFELGDRFIIAYVTGVREEGYAPLEQVRAEVEIAVLREKKAQVISDRIKAQMEGTTTLASLAQKMNLEVLQATGISFTSFSVPTAGIEPALIAAATTMPVNTLSEPITGNNGVYVISVTNTTTDESVTAENEKRRLQTSYQTRANYEAYEALKKKADIKDRRSKFF